MVESWFLDLHGPPSSTLVVFMVQSRLLCMNDSFLSGGSHGCLGASGSSACCFFCFSTRLLSTLVGEGYINRYSIPS